jgi:hypothetical protein
MEQIPTAKEFIGIHNRLNDSSTELLMIEFAKLHVKAALEASANEYYPKDKENFELVAKKFINAYSLDNIK